MMKKSRKQKYNKVIFDCDSTITMIEGIDELARIKGKYKQVAVLTKKAMGGGISFEKVFSKRLEIIKPEKKDLIKVAKLYIKNITPGAKKIIQKLQSLGIEVYLISGGYNIPVGYLAKYLKIKPKNVFANQLMFDKNGLYKGFNKKNLLCKDNGKKKIIQLIKKKGDRVVFIGDGANDLKARKVVDLFVGFGGVVKREKLAKQTKVYLNDLTLLLDIVNSKITTS